MKRQYENMLTKPEIQFWVPIMVYVITLVASFYSIKSDIRSLTEKLDTHVSKVFNLTTAVNIMESHVCRLDTLHEISCINSN